MQLHYCSDYDKMSKKGAEFLVSELVRHQDLLFCTATGNSPQGVYKNMALVKKEQSEIFNSLQVIKLDEWGGLPAGHPSSCEVFLKEHVLVPLDIPMERYIGFKNDVEDPVLECERIQTELKQRGPIDICILGMGKNGHIGFNEPAEFLNPHCHIAELTVESQKHQMVSEVKVKPKYGLTLGMADILSSKKILLLVTGSGKQQTIKKFLTGEINYYLPASLLWRHHDAHCFIDVSAS